MNYYNNDLQNPKYLFHGSPRLLDKIEQRQATDANNNKYNEDYAVFLTSSFLIASAYAFKDSIKKLSKGLEYDFSIGYDPDTSKEIISFKNVNVDDNIEGYIYVIPYDDKYDHQGRSIQYKCHDTVTPIDVVRVRFGDFKKYYSIEREDNYGYSKTK